MISMTWITRTITIISFNLDFYAMRNIVLIAFAAVYVSWIFPQTTVPPETFTVQATFLGFNDDYQYLFKDAENKIIVFDQVSEDLDYDLSLEDYIDDTFEITWKYLPVEMENEELDEGFDEEDSDFNSMISTSESDKYKIITALKRL
jgi:hypothetical protein